jgi:CheY-like chemotaxis protein
MLAKEVEGARLPTARPGETILLVEHDPDVRAYAKSILEELGYRVLQAFDVKEALDAIAHAFRIDLVITDAVMPGGSGRDLARQIREEGLAISVRFATGCTRNAIIHNGRRDPDLQLLNQPYTCQGVARKVRQLLDAAAKRYAPSARFGVVPPGNNCSHRAFDRIWGPCRHLRAVRRIAPEAGGVRCDGRKHSRS